MALLLGVLVAVAVLGLMAVVRRSWGLAIGLAGFVGAASVVAALAPPPLGAHYERPGTAVVGTLTDPDAQWSGSVTCGWQHGDPTVSSVAFEWPSQPLAPPALVGPPESDLERAHPARFGHLNLRFVPTSGQAIVTWEHDLFSNYQWWAEVEVLDLAGNGRTGTVDVGVDGLVISWTCEEGP